MATLCTSTCARSTVNSSGSADPARTTASFTVEPARSAHARHRRVEVGAHRRAVDGRDHVAAADAGGGGRRIAERPHHAQRAVGGGHFDADAGVGAGGADAQVGVFLGIEIGRVGIEPADQAAQRVVDELGVSDVVDVFALHALDDFGELRGFGGGQRVSCCGGLGRGAAAAGAARRRGARTRRRRGRSGQPERDAEQPTASWALNPNSSRVTEPRSAARCGVRTSIRKRARGRRPRAPAARRAPRPPGTGLRDGEPLSVVDARAMRTRVRISSVSTYSATVVMFIARASCAMARTIDSARSSRRMSRTKLPSILSMDTGMERR